jgi:hypothetical protein
MGCTGAMVGLAVAGMILLALGFYGLTKLP